MDKEKFRSIFCKEILMCGGQIFRDLAADIHQYDPVLAEKMIRCGDLRDDINQHIRDRLEML
jgi:hypothetical protein